jgi:hypothetical protein
MREDDRRRGHIDEAVVGGKHRTTSSSGREREKYRSAISFGRTRSSRQTGLPGIGEHRFDRVRLRGEEVVDELAGGALELVGYATGRCFSLRSRS